MQMLIEDLLSYSRMGTMEGDYEKIHLRDLIEEVKEILRDESISTVILFGFIANNF